MLTASPRSLSIIPGAGGTQLLSRLIGPSRAKYLIFSGRIFDREYAYQHGIIDELADDGPEEGEGHAHGNEGERERKQAKRSALSEF